ncbi:cyclopropane-fatty-acyl-phospholipid synthase [Corynebacterium sp. HMSC22B11]|uniref:class I SAM-dependent methyltransferase n=1 Tax=Corynebacterium sp. HMSC22B11 TaxID=1581056 RepID=UPI0008A1174A|nr:class I SAM-dependent methyltransferase [Corynebacterium sp. HMSC22B11]OFO12590.1 cyclopropane-fatty-acyl-phospholipid synthase [Corynebacterium sp. HMSC22B11]
MGCFLSVNTPFGAQYRLTLGITSPRMAESAPRAPGEECLIVPVERFSLDPYIDPERWPHLAELPRGRFLGKRSEAFRERLEELLDDEGVSFESKDETYLEVRDGLMLDRVVAQGWLGLAESYLIGEWRAEPLVKVLEVLLRQPLEAPMNTLLAGISPRKPRHDFGSVRAGELPDGLVELYAGATRATATALFASAARTTETVQVDRRTGEILVDDEEKPAPRGVAGVTSGVRRRLSRPEEPVSLDETWYLEPADVQRQDLNSGQLRRINLMLDEANVGPGDRVLELSSSGGQLAILAAQRGASVSVLTSDEEHAEVVRSRVRQAGVAGGVRVELISGPVPSPRQWAGEYDAIFSTERLETLGRGGLGHFFRAVDRLLADGGVAVVQTLVATPQMRDTARESLDVVRGYIWPALEYSPAALIRQHIFAAGLDVVAENHLGPHLAATLPMWRAHFASRERQAAAAGFDAIYRRLWDFQLALHQALVDAGDIDCMQFVIRHRH